MRYPVGKTIEDFKKNWYIASFFGEKRNGYYHSGDDFNLRTGGDSDLGQPLYAIADGNITFVDNASTTGFGKQIFLQFWVNSKPYWAMYAHCKDVRVNFGRQVKEGEVLGTLGKSGTKYAHLHLSIKNKANGIDNVPNTKEELKEWENPTAFLESHIKEGLPTFNYSPSKALPESWYEIDEAEEAIKDNLIENKDSFDTILAKFLDKNNEFHEEMRRVRRVHKQDMEELQEENGEYTDALAEFYELEITELQMDLDNCRKKGKEVKPMSEPLKNKKTYIAAVLIGVISAAYYLGFINDETFQSLLGLFGAGGLAALRFGVSKTK